MKLIFKHKSYLLISILLLLLSGTIFYTNEWAFLQPMLLAFSLIFLYIVALVYKISLKFERKIITIFLLFTVLSVISSLVNQDVELLMRTLILFLTFIGCVAILPNLILKHYKINEYSNIVVDAFLYSHVPLILIPIILNGLVLTSYNAYQGMFYNPNAFGLVMVTIFSLILSEVLNILDKYIFEKTKFDKRSIIFKILILIIILLLVIISSSRTSAITALCLIIFSLYLLIRKSVKTCNVNVKKLKKSLGVVIIVILLSTTLYVFTPIGNVINDSILTKFELKSYDVFDGRTNVWSITIEEARLFGHGRGFFDEKISAHNTFISILAQYGWIPLFVFIILLYKIYLSVYNYALSSISDKYSYFPLLVFVTFIVTSIGEGMLYKVSMFLMLICYGNVLMITSKNHSKKIN